MRRALPVLGFGAAFWAVCAHASVLIEPQGIRLQSPGKVQRIIVSGGSGCKASSYDPAVVAIESDRLVARAPGSARIAVHCEEGSAETEVDVGESSSSVGIGFERDLLSILTTKGCNSSACHGSPAGQNGFKLSLYGSDPRLDHDMIVNGHEGRRVTLGSPADSLLVAKPTFRIAHGGGQLMTVDSDEYATMLEWLRQGAPYGTSGTRLERLEMHPAERVLVGAGSRQPVVVVGRLSDGTTRDMTRRGPLFRQRRGGRRHGRGRRDRRQGNGHHHGPWPAPWARLQPRSSSSSRRPPPGTSGIRSRRT